MSIDIPVVSELKSSGDFPLLQVIVYTWKIYSP